MKLHVGNGTVYLKGWHNIDIEASGSALARDQFEYVRKWGTTEDQYYAKMPHITPQLLSTGYRPDHGETVCDAYGSWGYLPVDDDSVDEILSRQVFEHLSIREAREALGEARRVLKMGGLLRLSVPDHDASMELWKETGDVFFKRHVVGSLKNDAAWHVMGWTRSSLKALLAEYGFEFVEEEPNIHCYPAICMKFRKASMKGDQNRIESWKAAWQYAGEPLGTPLKRPDGMVLEVGCGRNPWVAADVFCDIDADAVEFIPERTLFHQADVQELPGEWSGRFSFVLASHVLEHIADPLKACAELSRVAKAGCIICPSPFKEGLWSFEETDHKWLVEKRGDELVFRRMPHHVDGLRNRVTHAWMHRLLRYGDVRIGDDSERIRRWWKNAEPHYDTIYRWTGEIKARIEE